MKHLGILLILILSVQSQNLRSKHSGNKQILENLAKLENTYINTLGFKERRHAIKLMNKIIKQIDGRSFSSKKTRHSKTMAPEVFGTFLKQLTDEVSDSNKLEILTQTIKFGGISSKQMSQIIPLFTFKQLEAFKASFKYIYDKVNISLVINSMKWPQNTKALEYLKTVEVK